MKKECWIHIIAITALILFIGLGLASATGPSPQERERQEAEQRWQRQWEERNAMLASINYVEIPFNQLRSSISSVSTDGQGFIVEAYVIHPDWMYFIIGENSPEQQILSVGGFSMSMGYEISGGIRLGAQNFDRNNPDIDRQLERDRRYRVYIAVLKEDQYGSSSDSYNGIVTRIDGLRSVSEVTAAREERQRAAEQATEEANRYDPSRFTLVPSGFKPAEFEAVDLFDAVSRVERMPRGRAGTLDEVLNVFEFVSDVVFVNQSGTNIQFRTVDNAISQNMNIDSRSGLTSGQRVRVYYKVSKNPLTDWRVVAIERL